VVDCPLQRFYRINICMATRKLCPACNHRPVGINYIKEGVTHYRSVCDTCNRKGKKIKPRPPAWVQSGYRKKPHCEKCGFKSKIPEQMSVFHVDGNLKNNNWVNLKSICLNCQQEIFQSRLGWKPSPIVPDF
jgi:DnaJ-class molecular chaperone